MADLRPADDDSIPGTEPLYIRIYPALDALVLVEGGHYRPNTGSVRGRKPDQPLSCDLGSLCTPEQTRDRGTDGNFHVAMITAGTVRQLGLRVRRDPIIDGPVPNPAHALVYGKRIDSHDNQAGGLTSGEYSRLAHAARVVLITGQAGPPVYG
jgi:hypothetical protein